MAGQPARPLPTGVSVVGRDRKRSASPPPSGAPRSVCLYTPSYNASGMGVHMLALADVFSSWGIEVTLMYWPAPATEALLAQGEALGARLVRTAHPRHAGYGHTLVEHVSALRPEVFHVHIGTGREDFGGARAARTAGVPAIVQTLHLPWLLSSRRKQPRFFRSIAAVDHLIAVSGALRDTYEAIGIPRERLSTVPNGVAPRPVDGPGRAAARRLLGLDPEGPVLMTVGRLSVMKGHRYLVEALPRLAGSFPDLVAVVVGDGHLRTSLGQLAERLGVGHMLRLTGHRGDARQLLDAADVFVLPSRHEGMPLVLLEAMELGLPTVATRVIGTEEVVMDGVTGVLVPPEDSEALAVALRSLLADRELAAAYGRAARDRYLEHHTAEHMAAATLGVYSGLVRPVGGGVSASSRDSR